MVYNMLYHMLYIISIYYAISIDIYHTLICILVYTMVYITDIFWHIHSCVWSDPFHMLAVGSLNNDRTAISRPFAWRPLACLPILKTSAFTNTSTECQVYHMLYSGVNEIWYITCYIAMYITWYTTHIAETTPTFCVPWLYEPYRG